MHKNGLSMEQSRDVIKEMHFKQTWSEMEKDKNDINECKY